MNISTRTPEGVPSRCPLCGAENAIEYSDPAGDAPCPNCGHLLWHAARRLAQFQDRLSASYGVPRERVTASATLSDLGADSLDSVELVMELEEEFAIAISDDDDARIRTVGDMIRYLEGRQSRPDQ